MTAPNPKLERLIDQASASELRRLVRELIDDEPHLIYPVIGALGERETDPDDPGSQEYDLARWEQRVAEEEA